MKTYISAFLDLVFPRPCLGCGASLLSQENQICIRCLTDLPRHEIIDRTEADLRFWGRLPVQRSFSFLKYNRKGVVQQLIYQLKYRNQPELGIFLGKYFGESLKKIELDMDNLVAIPLHASREKQRGYNQAQCIAEGLSESTEIPVLSHVIQRTKATNTQTKRTRTERYENVENIFEVLNPEGIKGKHIGIVDDVITTGATIEACGMTLLHAGARSVSVISLAVVS